MIAMKGVPPTLTIKVCIFHLFYSATNLLSIMAGRNPCRGGCSGRGHGDGRGGGGEQCCSYNDKNKSIKVGLCKDLEGNSFDYGMKTCADLM